MQNIDSLAHWSYCNLVLRQQYDASDASLYILDTNISQLVSLMQNSM